ncbi:ornithine carbamoyltransferase [Parenemella sanctibonifatiensis]|uniref:Ornithine carbamoyltransferase n=1 Tax=Parenemella sanctibonifatiensis TaxID=2016505 RepID=A0A255EGS1_9ACTN|nr:ornithine carbamoyltransferase [Parenemella sanctibonifatiensis]OYN90171.1 ornithine carbamoyltransferase [Parenemella sanctibonifatiensis]
MDQRHFLREADFTPAQWHSLVNLSAFLKAERRAGNEQQRLLGRTIALIFEKTSTRTRSAFEVAAAHQGAATTYLDSRGSQIGHKESIPDTARVLGRMYDAIEYRGFGQERVSELAAYAGVPVLNGLTDEWHPTQSLCDMLTMAEHCGKERISYAYLGDARNNVANSLLVAGALMGHDVRLVGPSGLQPEAEVVALAEGIAAETGATLRVTDNVAEGVADCDFLHTDVWVSMGEPAEVWEERIEQLSPYQVNAAAMAATGNDQVKAMHCLPAYHDLGTTLAQEVHDSTGRTELEITHEVFEANAEVIFDQAENRMHSIKAVLVWALTGETA